MQIKTIVSAAILGLSSAALAQVATPTEPKTGNAAADNLSAPANTANASDADGNTTDPGKR